MFGVWGGCFVVVVCLFSLLPRHIGSHTPFSKEYDTMNLTFLFVHSQQSVFNHKDNSSPVGPRYVYNR